MPGGGWPGNQINASYYNGVTYFGYIDTRGALRVSSYDHTTHDVATSPGIVTGLTADIHSAPSVLVRSSDHKILIAVAPHATAHMYVAVSTNAEDVSAWGSATDINSTLGGTQYTYANLFQLSGESGKIYLFFRDAQDTAATNVLCYSTSTDAGSTWAAQTALYKTASALSYWVIDSDSTDRIDIATDDGTAVEGDAASLYHFYYSSSAFRTSDGTAITGTKPYGVSSLTKVYDSTNGAVRVPTSVASGSTPCVVFAAANATDWATNPEVYWYAKYSSGSWDANEITDCGADPNDNLFESGVTIDQTDSSRVFLGKVADGQYQMFAYTTSDGGTTWTSSQLTSDADQPNWHPVSVRDADAGLTCLWSYGPAQPNGAFCCQIRGYPNPVTAF